jgi:lipoprotein-anchoring transpeptidase ErfK/SrfK
MSKKTVEKYKAVKQKNKTPVITPAEHRANCEVVADMLMDVIDRLPKDAPPVTQTFAELLNEMNHLTGRRETIVNSDGRRIRYNADGSQTVLNSGVTIPVAVPTPENDMSIESSAENENPTAKMITDMKRERFEKSVGIMPALTKFDTGTDTKIDTCIDTGTGASTFTDIELETLRKIQNGE